MERAWDKDRRMERERDDEMLQDLAEAVFAGDLVRAEGVLELMHAAGRNSELIRRAKYRARPDLAPRSAPPLRDPLVLPHPGHRPGTYGLHQIERERARA